ncbi:MAG TPA: hypothetical protein VGH33_26765 [Isosphaeraceae bacterium]
MRLASGAAFLLMAWAAHAHGQDGPRPAIAPSGDGEGLRSSAVMSLIAAAEESLFGDVYAQGRWRPLTFRSFFTDGWLEPWGEAPAGRDGHAPRHGWLGSFNGVFYRLWTTNLDYTNALNTAYHGNRYDSSLSVFLPFSRRFELLIDEPYLVANGTTDVRRGYITQSGDLTITPRFLLAEDEATTHIFSLDVRTPTGSPATGGGLLSLNPRYEFWNNPVGPWVARGSASFAVPIGHAPASGPTSFVGGFALGRYFTPHDVPFGDLVFYAACDLAVPLDRTSSTSTSVTIGPGTRFHLGEDFYILNFWGFPVTGPHPDAYSVQFGIVKIF